MQRTTTAPKSYTQLQKAITRLEQAWLVDCSLSARQERRLTQLLHQQAMQLGAY